jgi:hypothetical protein
MQEGGDGAGDKIRAARQHTRMASGTACLSLTPQRSPGCPGAGHRSFQPSLSCSGGVGESAEWEWEERAQGPAQDRERQVQRATRR